MHKYWLGKLHIIILITGAIYSLFHFVYTTQYSNGRLSLYPLENKNFLNNQQILQSKVSVKSQTKLEQGERSEKAEGPGLFHHFNMDFDFAETEVELEEDLDGKLDFRELSNISYLLRIFQNLCIRQNINLATNQYISAVWRPPQY